MLTNKDEWMNPSSEESCTSEYFTKSNNLQSITILERRQTAISSQDSACRQINLQSDLDIELDATLDNIIVKKQRKVRISAKNALLKWSSGYANVSSHSLMDWDLTSLLSYSNQLSELENSNNDTIVKDSSLNLNQEIIN